MSAPQRSAADRGGPEGNGALVRCVDVSCSFGGRTAVSPVSGLTCQVLPGDRVAVVGRSGSGKSTLLHLLAGLQGPSDGEVTWPALGHSPAGDPTYLSVVFQAPSLVDSLTVVENVALPLLFADLPADEARERALASLARLEVGSLADHLPHELSGGQAQRVVTARVVAIQPRIILADEPTSRLDRWTAARTIARLLEVSDEVGAALVVATHDGEVAAHLDSRWTVLEGGVPVECEQAAS